MILIFNQTGFIEQVQFNGDYDRLKPLYKADGLLVMHTTETLDLRRVYIDNPTDELRRRVVPRPEVEVAFDRDTLKADGIDEIVLTPNMPCKVAVTHNDIFVKDGELDGEPLHFSVNQAGIYAISFSAEFPYLPAVVFLEAQP